MRIVKYAVLGALVGLCVAFLVGIDTLCSGNATCANGCKEFINDPKELVGILGVILIFAVFGGIFGMIQTVQDNDAVQKATELEQRAFAEKQRAIRASDVKQKALNLSNTCSKNKSDDKPLVTATYEANVKMAEIMNELVKVAEKQGKVDSVAEELSKKGGASV